MMEWVWLLLPVAAASGWFAAVRSARKQSRQACFDVNSDYFKGLNYLLNEQPDKAIEVFIRMVEVDGDTVETHLALGSLFRRRGEVDRAIRIHQNLIARPTLTHEQRSHALLELGEDYMKAGLLDRAEHLFLELIELHAHVEAALNHLIDIYQQEQDWDLAIETCHQYESASGKHCGEVIAQYCCELAEKAMREGDQQQLELNIKKAFEHDRNCVRASMLLGSRDQKAGHYEEAISHFKKAAEQDIDYIPEIIDALQDCYTSLGEDEKVGEFLDKIEGQYDGVTPMLYKAELLLKQGHEKDARDFMVHQLSNRPSVRGLQWLVELNLYKSEGRARENLTILRDLIMALLNDRPVYKCQQCGFSGKSMHWQCPGCKQWNTVKPIKGVDAE